MANSLKIKGMKSTIINPVLNIEIGIFLSALYNNREYNLKLIRAASVDNKISLAVLSFDPEDKKYEEGGLNHIALLTTFGGNYRATGISHISKIDPKETKFYRMGDDLEIIIDKTAEEAIESIKDCQYEIDRAELSQGIPTDYLGLLFSPN